MGIYERDYISRQPHRGISAALRIRSVTTWLIILNIAVFLIDQMLVPEMRVGRYILKGVGPLEKWGYFSFQTALGEWQIWRFLSFQFLHANAGHLLGNMLSLYFFGPLVESYFGRGRYLRFYLLCGMAGAASYLLLWVIGVPWGGKPLIHAASPMVGASAGIFGVLMAAACIAPNAEVMLLLPPVPVSLRSLAWVMMGVAAYTVFSQGHNAGGEAAHLGGGLLGFAIIKIPQWLRTINGRRNHFVLLQHRADEYNETHT
jgi:membrane associated rhomboid family serine protease